MSHPVNHFHLAARQGLKAFMGALEEYNSSDIEHFRSIVSISTMLFEVHIKHLAQHFKISTFTVCKWADGEVIPPFTTRAEVKLYLLEKLAAQLPREKPE